jgi:hypothetical protein
MLTFLSYRFVRYDYPVKKVELTVEYHIVSEAVKVTHVLPVVAL